MERTRNRLITGLILALAVGAFGPIQQAVSHESKTYVEISGPLFPDLPPYELTSVWTQSKRGAEASWQVASGATRTTFTLLAAVGNDAEASVRYNGYDANAQNDRRAFLRVRTCSDDYYTCQTQIWRGADTFSYDPPFTSAAFAGTLTDPAGGTCTVDAAWTARGGHNVRFHETPLTHPRTRTPALLEVATSCIGTHRVDGPGAAAMWTDHIIQVRR